MPCNSAPWRQLRRFIKTGVAVATVLSGLLSASLTQAQPFNMHNRHASDLPPGAIGRCQVPQGGPLAGYYQAIELRAPRGATISLANDLFFDRAQPSPRGARMLVGSVYRFKVTNISENPGVELFPTVEVIDRTYPPSHQAPAFPVEVVMTQQDLLLALSGKLVTRVIYLEDPHKAQPTRQRPGDQEWFEAGEGDNAMDIARGLGRPMAILRIGGRVPGQNGPSPQFMYGSPPWMPFEIPRQPAVAPAPAAPPAPAAEEVPAVQPASYAPPRAMPTWSTSPRR